VNYTKAFAGGNLTRDIELRYTPSGAAVANFTVAVNRKFEGKEEVSFIDCVAWSKTAEFISGNFIKGQGIFVSGRLQQRRWEKDGAKMSKLEIVVEDAQFTTPKKEKMDVATLDDGPVQDEEVPF